MAESFTLNLNETHHTRHITCFVTSLMFPKYEEHKGVLQV